jgi:hypothetical protein
MQAVPKSDLLVQRIACDFPEILDVHSRRVQDEIYVARHQYSRFLEVTLYFLYGLELWLNSRYGSDLLMLSMT